MSKEKLVSALKNNTKVTASKMGFISAALLGLALIVFQWVEELLYGLQNVRNLAIERRYSTTAIRLSSFMH